MRKTPLKRYTQLKAHKGLNKMSDRAKEELKIWREVKIKRIQLLLDKFGYVPCEYCLKRIIEGSELYCAEGHHNDHNRRNNSEINQRIVHRTCNQEIELRHVKNVPSLLEVNDNDSEGVILN